jgi:hypothetical protein
LRQEGRTGLLCAAGRTGLLGAAGRTGLLGAAGRTGAKPRGGWRQIGQRRGHHLAAAARSPHTGAVSTMGRITMIYELRIYESVPGRLPDLNNRFSTITLKIWERHGIRQAGFWTTLIGESNMTLYYMLAWESLAERETKWNAFQADPEWHAARAKTEEKGPIVAKVTNYILGPTPYSAVR